MTDLDGREGWTQEERELYDAKADEEAWSHTIEILEPMLEIGRLFGTPELTWLMEKALAEARSELNRALGVLEPLVEREEDKN